MRATAKDVFWVNGFWLDVNEPQKYFGKLWRNIQKVSFNLGH